MSTSSDPFFTTTDGMTAVFTPSTSCSTMWTYEPQSANSIPGGILMQNAVYESVSKNTDCYPSGYAQWGRAPSFMQVFSPGACPHGYATVGQFDGHAEQATTAICCPSDFGYTQAVSIVRGDNKTASFWGCTSTYPQSAPSTTVFAINSGFTSTFNREQTSFTAVSGPILMWAQVVSVAYGSKDLSLFSPGPITSPPTSTPTTTSTSQNMAETSSTSRPDTPASLSSGAIAGIAIGAIALVGIMMGMVYFLWLKRRRNNTGAAHCAQRPNGSSKSTPHQPMYRDEPSGLSWEQKVETSGDWEAQQNGHVINELDGASGRRYELSHGNN